MSSTTAIVGILILAIVFLVWRSKRSTPQKSTPPGARPVKATPVSEFHAVSIKYAASACLAAKRLEGKRYLSSAAPKIPLPDCDVLECKCRFVHHADRREGDERRNPYRAGIAGETGKHEQEQRQGADRRKDSDPF